MNLSTRCALLATTGFVLSTGVFSAKAAPAYRAGWAGAINYNVNQWHYSEDIPDNTVPEWGVFTGPICVRDHATGYAWGLKGFWNSGWMAEWGKTTCWGGYRCWCFWGQMYFDGSTYYFGEKISRYILFRVDGVNVLNDSNADNFTCRSITPTAGWHDVLFRAGSDDAGNNGTTPPGAIDKGADGKLLGFGYAKTSTAPTGMGGLNYFSDSGNGALLRNVAPSDFFTVNSFSVNGTTYSVNITAAADLPAGASAVVYLGSASSVAENGSESTWNDVGTAVAIGAGETKDVSATWTGSGTPHFSVKVSGMLDSLDLGYVGGGDSTIPVSGGPQLAFWQWSDPAMATVVPNVAASFTGVTDGTQADFSVALGYDIEIPGQTPDITVTAYYGAADAGTTAANWASSYAFGDKATGNHALSIPGLTSGESYYVRFAAQTPGSNLIWSDPMYVSLSGVFLSGLPASVNENDPATFSFTVNRPADTVDSALTVNLSYAGDTSLVTELPASVTIPAGSASATVTFKTIDNATADGNASFTVGIAAGTYVVGSPASMSAAILDDETAGAEITWTGAAGDNQWNTPGNWSANRVPGSMDTANFVYAGTFGDGTARSVTVTGEAAVKLLKVATGDALTLKDGGSGRLTLSGLDRGTAGWPWGVLTIQIPVTLYAGADGTNTWNTGNVDVIVESDVSKIDPVVWRKVGGTINYNSRNNDSGRLILKKASQTYNGTTHVAQGTLRFELGSTSKTTALKGVLDIGGGDAPASVLIPTGNDREAFKNSNIRINVYTNGTLDLEANSAIAGVGDVHIHNGGKIGCPWFDPSTVTLYGGGKLDKAASWSGVCRPTRSGTALTSKASDIASYAIASLEPQVWSDFDMYVEDGAAPVDIEVTKLGESAYGAYSKGPYTKSGPGTMKIVGACTTKRGLTIKAGTVLADDGTASCSTSNVTVNAGATLGGIGRIACTTFDGGYCATAVFVKGTVAPGSVVTDVGDRIFGTLTIGSDDKANGIEFQNNSKLHITFGPRYACNDLKVYGAMTIGTGTELILDASDYDNLRGGDYVIATADGGVSGEFATVTIPEGTRWKVLYDTDTITVCIPGQATLILLR